MSALDCPPEVSQSYLRCLQFVSRWEGGYVNHPNDIGGKTNQGVTQAVYSDWLRRNNREDRSVRFITPREVCRIYHELYWLPIEAGRYSSKLALVAFDTAVNFGVGGAIKFLQMVAGRLAVDGALGPLTRARLADLPHDVIAAAVVGARIDYRYARVQQSPTQQVFLAGWLNRDYDLLSQLFT